MSDNETVDDTDEYDYIAIINDKKGYKEFVKNKHVCCKKTCKYIFQNQT
jgi:hypothetical protein